MRVLLSGASGAIGRYLVPQLIEAKHEVIGITRTPGSLRDTGAREVIADVLDRPALLSALKGIRADAVIHQLTALAKAPSTFRDMRPTNRLRTEGTSALIAAARAVGAKKFVAASFFGGYGLRDHGREPLTELAPFGELDRQADAVQTALLSLEQQVRAFGGVSLRFGLFYDSTASEVSPVSRTWDGLLPMLHVSDAAAATVRVLAKYRAGAVYNIADDSPMTYRAREVARAQAADLRPPIELPDRVLRVAAPFGALLLTRASIILSTARAFEELGWQPQYPSLLESLAVDASEPKAEREPKEKREPRARPLRKRKEEPTPKHERKPEPQSTATADDEAESVIEPESVMEPESVIEAESVMEPVPVIESESVTKVVTVAEASPAVEVSANPAPDTRAAVSVASSASDNPFHDTDAAIARIGRPHDD